MYDFGTAQGGVGVGVATILGKWAVFGAFCRYEVAFRDGARGAVEEGFARARPRSGGVAPDEPKDAERGNEGKSVGTTEK